MLVILDKFLVKPWGPKISKNPLSIDVYEKLYPKLRKCWIINSL